VSIFPLGATAAAADPSCITFTTIVCPYLCIYTAVQAVILHCNAFLK
jgi:hypothetical protein